MSTDKRYNGWNTYETWLVGLWIDNEQGDSEFWREQATEQYERAEATDYATREQIAIRDLADALKNSFESSASDLTGVTGFWVDLLNSALSEVDWFELAKHYIDEAVAEVQS